MGGSLGKIGAFLVTGGMSSFFPEPKKPKSPGQPPPAPSEDPEAIAAAEAEAAKEREEASKRVSRQRTILTSPKGVEEEAPLGPKTLLGFGATRKKTTT